MMIQADMPATPCGFHTRGDRRVPPRGATPAEGMASLLEETFPCGVLRRDGAVVGAWLTYGLDGALGGPVLAAAWRDGEGLPRATTRLEPRLSEIRAGIDLSMVRVDLLEGAPGFGHVVGFMDALGGGHGPERGTTIHRRLDTMRWDMGNVLSNCMPGAPGHGEAVRARMDAVAGAAAPFLATLDPEALALCRAKGLFDVLSRAWDGIDATFSPRRPLAEAVATAPSCARVLAEEWDECRDAVREAGADASGPALVRFVAASAGVPAAATQRWESLACWKQARSGSDTGAVPEARWALRALALAATFPVDWLPRDGDWDGFVGAASTVMAACTASSPVGPAGTFVRRPWLGHAIACGGRWADWHAGLAREAGREPYGAVRDLADMARALAAQVVAPAHALGEATHGDGYGAAFRALFAGRGIRHAVAMSRDWHAARGRMDATMRAFAGAVPPGDGWATCLPAFAFEDVAVVPLASPDDLRDEGMDGPDREGRRGLRHCVADYARECRAGRYRVLSVRRTHADGTWSRLSTVGMVLMDGRPTVEQHRGQGNDGPHPDARFALHKYLQHLSVSGLAAGVSWPALPEDGGPAAAGYDWAIPGAWDAVARLWDPHLPRALRGMDAAAWRALPPPAPGESPWPARPVCCPVCRPAGA